MGLFQTWKEVMFNPMEFYEKLPDKIRYKEPSIFYLKIHAILLAVIFLLGFLIFGMFFSLIGIMGKEGAIFGSLGLGAMILIGLVAFPLLLLFSWGMLFVGSAITHLFVLLFGGKKGYKETFKAVSYSIAPTVFSFIPIINWVVGIYTLVLQVIGIHKRQKLSIGRSVGAILLPVAILVFLFLIIYFALLFLVFAGKFAGGVR